VVGNIVQRQTNRGSLRKPAAEVGQVSDLINLNPAVTCWIGSKTWPTRGTN